MNIPLHQLITRRFLFAECGVGLGKIALASLLGTGLARSGSAADRADSLARRPPHFAPRAKRVIFLFMAGGPSHLDLFDHKPALWKYDGQQVPPEVIEGYDLPFIERDAALMASPIRFARHGECGAEISELLPHLATIVDDIVLVKSMRTDAFNHAPS